MSPHQGRYGFRCRRFPRVSGDEPEKIKLFLRWHEFSPRERG